MTTEEKSAIINEAINELGIDPRNPNGEEVLAAAGDVAAEDLGSCSADEYVEE